MSYGADLADIFATYVDKILRGAKPNKRLVQLATKFELERIRRRCFMAGCPCLDCTNHPLTQILRIGVRHRRLSESIARDPPSNEILGILQFRLPIQSQRIML